ncbi:MAG: PIN domain-containing protein [Luteolibacter sp.]|uniref:type II toxin-antitoxin system VapC family toxin n=1 Tax=Luteolibacter sp. TaxID=1962973 RepID=UPI003266B8C4
MNPVLVDSCVWVRHFRQRNPLLVDMLVDGEVWCHPIVVGELSMGMLKDRQQTLFDLAKLNRPPIATFAETRQMVESRRLWGRGIQWNDARILASAILGQVPLWTFDIRLNEIAKELGVAYLT